jgi:nucleotide-binding universal stress UspA family protein
MNRIVIATDGSVCATAAVTEGVQLAFEVGAEVTFVYVRQSPGIFGEPLYQHRLSEQLARAESALDQAKAEAATLGVPCESEILEGDPARRIAVAAQEWNADLVVVGSRGHGAITSAVVGSVSRALLRRSPVPVMVVRERTAARVAA